MQRGGEIAYFPNNSRNGMYFGYICQNHLQFIMRLFIFTFLVFAPTLFLSNALLPGMDWVLPSYYELPCNAADTVPLSSKEAVVDSLNPDTSHASVDSMGYADSLNRWADFTLVSPVKFRSANDTALIYENPALLELCVVFLQVLVEYDRLLLLQHAPKYEDYLIFIDSTDADQYPEVMKRYRFKVFESTLSKQYKRLRKDAQELKISFRRAEPRLYFLESGIHPEYNKAFCYINLEFRIKKKELIRVRILALQMGNNWYFADDLALIAK